MSTVEDRIAAPFPGLSDEEAGRRRAAGQGNDVEIRTGRTYGRIVRDNVFNFINDLFYFLGILLLVLGKPLDAFSVVFVIAVNTVISLVQEVRAKRVMDRIAILMRPKADVVRGGYVLELDPSLVVVGDVLRLQPGDQVVVDGPMLGEGRMEVDESLLTGESDLVSKHPGDVLMSGSFCMTGGGYYEAQKVGAESFANKMTAKASAFRRELTPLQKQINQIVRVLLIVVIVFETLVWIRNTFAAVPFVESVRMSTVILALIPNGLVLSIALTYALGAIRLLGKDMLVQQFNAVESLSNVDVLCTDKTGTLTSGVVKADELLALRADEARAEQLVGAFAASTTDANRTVEALRAAYPAQRAAAAHEAFFSSERKWSGLAFEAGEARGTYVLGAPEMVAPALRAGEEGPAQIDWRPRAAEWAARGLRVVLFAGRPEPLAFGEPDGPPALPAGLEPVALIAFSDELRGGVQQTLEEFAEAGIEVKIISGDSPGTVTALATQAGVHALARREGMDGYCEALVGDAAGAPAAAGSSSAAAPGGGAFAAEPRDLIAVSGAELEAMTPEEFGAAAERSTIFGRVTPEQKQDLVEALRARGRYVAMIGDGVNDVIALKQANVAVAMQGGSQAARSVGDLILMKDTFQPLPFAFREGQRIINGMNDILRIFMVRIFFKALMIAIVTAIGGFPFTPRQSALLSLVGATVPSIAFALWARPGATPKVGLFKLLARFVAPTALLMAGIATGVYLAWAIPAHNAYNAAHPGHENELVELSFPQAQTALTIFACFAAILLILLIVPPTKWWAGGAPLVRGDWRIVAVVGALRAFMVGVLLIPVGRTAFELTALPLWQYAVLFVLAVVWSMLCRLVWRSRILDRWLGTAEDPGNYCAQAVPPKPV